MLGLKIIPSVGSYSWDYLQDREREEFWERLEHDLKSFHFGAFRSEYVHESQQGYITPHGRTSRYIMLTKETG